MINQSDLALLKQMKAEVDVDIGLDQMAWRLLQLRDKLSFHDPDWYHCLTQHIATLDSASTFRPASAAERQQLEVATLHALDEIKVLIGERLG
jgi:hypothetical protein